MTFVLLRERISSFRSFRKSFKRKIFLFELLNLGKEFVRQDRDIRGRDPGRRENVDNLRRDDRAIENLLDRKLAIRRRCCPRRQPTSPERREPFERSRLHHGFRAPHRLPRPERRPSKERARHPDSAGFPFASHLRWSLARRLHAAGQESIRSLRRARPGAHAAFRQGLAHSRSRDTSPSRLQISQAAQRPLRPRRSRPDADPTPEYWPSAFFRFCAIPI